MKPIALTGFMCAGKTVIGEQISALLKYDFCDLDQLIEAKLNKNINEIFHSHGEEYFRRQEEAIFKDVSTRKLNKIVVATGGGIVLSRKNREVLSDYFCIFLNPPWSVLKARLIKHSESRPIAKSLNLIELEEVWQSRLNFYEQVADLVINDCSKIEKVVKLIETELIKEGYRFGY
jgi:shikimate kinase